MTNALEAKMDRPTEVDEVLEAWRFLAQEHIEKVSAYRRQNGLTVANETADTFRSIVLPEGVLWTLSKSLDWSLLNPWRAYLEDQLLVYDQDLTRDEEYELRILTTLYHPWHIRSSNPDAWEIVKRFYEPNQL